MLICEVFKYASKFDEIENCRQIILHDKLSHIPYLVNI
jgi:hypothetical protein